MLGPSVAIDARRQPIELLGPLVGDRCVRKNRRTPVRQSRIRTRTCRFQNRAAAIAIRQGHITQLLADLAQPITHTSDPQRTMTECGLRWAVTLRDGMCTSGQATRVADAALCARSAARARRGDEWRARCACASSGGLSVPPKRRTHESRVHHGREAVQGRRHRRRSNAGVKQSRVTARSPPPRKISEPDPMAVKPRARAPG
jgi:hypothetical protein